MNKKFLSAVLFGALMVTSTGTFVSCKDYDDDIDQLKTEVTANTEAIKKLQDLMGEGKFITGVSKTDAGLVFTMSNGGSSITIPLTDGTDGTIVTISEDGYWVLDGKKTTVKAKGETGETGAAGKDAKSPKISATTGNWEIWDVTKGEYVDSGQSAIGAQTYIIDYGTYYELNVMEQDANGKNIGFKSVKLPMSATLFSIIPQFTDGSINIYYGLLNEDVAWNGHKAVDGKMLKGMYPTTDRDIKMLLNPIDVDANAYDFKFVASDNTTPWGLNFTAPTPWVGKATTATRAITVTSENGVWAFPRSVQKVDLTDLQGRPDYALQFKKNDGEQYLFALKATSKMDAKNAVLSSYKFKFKADNVNSNRNIKFEDGLTFAPSGNNFVYNKEYKPTFDMFETSGSFTAAEDSALVYDYYLEIDKSKITDENIRKYGLEITADGYRFIAKKEAVVNNTVQFIYNYILINGKTGSTTFKVNFNDEEASVTDQFIGNFTAPFNAVKNTDIDSHTYALSHTFSLDKFFEGLGASGKMKWIDAIARSINAAGATTDPKEINKAIFDKKEDGTDTEFAVELLGGDPINNSGTAINVAKYNAALLSQYMDFDYVDAEGNTCLTGTIRDLDKIAALKVTFKANTQLGHVAAPYYTTDGMKYNPESTTQKVAMPLDNAFRVSIATRYDQFEVSKMNFSFELNMPTNCPIKRETVGNQTCMWDGNALTVYGEKLGENKIAGDLRDAFKGAFVYQNKAYGEKTVEAGWYEVALGERYAADQLIGMKVNGDKTTLGSIAKSSVYTDWNTIGYFTATTFANWTVKDVKYYHFNVYTESLEDFTVKFASKIADSKKAESKGTETAPFAAKAVYSADNKTVLRYEFSVDKSSFTMADAFNNSYNLFDDAAFRANSYTNLLEERQGIVVDKTAPSYYGLYPTAKIDGNSAASLVTYALDNATPAAKTTKMTITIDASVGIEKVAEFTYSVKDVFGHSTVVTFYAKTQNK